MGSRVRLCGDGRAHRGRPRGGRTVGPSRRRDRQRSGTGDVRAARLRVPRRPPRGPAARVRLRWETPTPVEAARVWQALGVAASTVEIVTAKQPRLILLDGAEPTAAAPTLRLGIASVDAERYAA